MLYYAENFTVKFQLFMSSTRICLMLVKKNRQEYRAQEKEHLFIGKSQAIIGYKKQRREHHELEKDVIGWKKTNDALFFVFFQPIMARLFPVNSHAFSCALHFDYSC